MFSGPIGLVFLMICLLSISNFQQRRLWCSFALALYRLDGTRLEDLLGLMGKAMMNVGIPSEGIC